MLHRISREQSANNQRLRAESRLTCNFRGQSIHSGRCSLHTQHQKIPDYTRRHRRHTRHLCSWRRNHEQSKMVKHPTWGRSRTFPLLGCIDHAHCSPWGLPKHTQGHGKNFFVSIRRGKRGSQVSQRKILSLLSAQDRKLTFPDGARRARPTEVAKATWAGHISRAWPLAAFCTNPMSTTSSQRVAIQR